MKKYIIFFAVIAFALTSTGLFYTGFAADLEGGKYPGIVKDNPVAKEEFLQVMDSIAHDIAYLTPDQFAGVMHQLRKLAHQINAIAIKEPRYNGGGW